jgi:hypothetical protein
MAGSPAWNRDHLRVRTRERELSKEDLAALLDWIRTDPEVPDGPSVARE